MIRGLYTAAAGMIAKQAQQETLSNNIANMNTAGFKKDKLILKSFDELVIKNIDGSSMATAKKRVVGSLEFGVGIDQNKTYFDQGVIEYTDRKLDFAITGDGFFTLEDENGNEKYSRDGRFQVNQEGYLVNSEGLKVLGEVDGVKSPIQVNNSEIMINSDGSFDIGDSNIKFSLTRFPDTSTLAKEASNCYISKDQSGEADTQSKITQQALERSNVDMLDAMTEMISIMRSYESNQKMVQTMDETLGKTVNEVGKL